MPAIRAEGQWLHPSNGGKGQRSIEVREQVSAAGRLIAKSFAQRIDIDGNQQQVVLPGKMPFSRLTDLFGY